MPTTEHEGNSIPGAGGSRWTDGHMTVSEQKQKKPVCLVRELGKQCQ